ncbi:putative oxidoreductase, partial [Escherichia coli EC1848]
KVVIRVAGDD